MRAMMCATVTGGDSDELRLARDAVHDADLVELRLDYARDIDITRVLDGRTRPVLVTCRPTWEGGRFEGSEEERAAILRRAWDLGADYVDVEWNGPSAELLAASGGRRVVLSMHDFEGVPSDLEERYRAMCATGAQVVKLAVRPDRLSDLVRLRRLAREDGVLEAAGRQRVLVGMGPVGLPTRLLPDWFGSAWTYGGGVAPGQVSVSRLRHEFRIDRAGAETPLYGVLGRPLAHSLSPAMHNAGFAASGRDGVYVPLEAADIADFWTFAEAFDLRGASVTAPFKQDVLTNLTEVDALGRRVGAVNTVRPAPSGWEGMNTDVPGFLAPLEGRVTLPGSRASVLGAGGAARGVVVALGDQGARVTVHARNVERAQAVASLVDGAVGEWPPADEAWDLLVNTTPIGTHPHEEDSPIGEVGHEGSVVYDLVYNPMETRLMREAAAAGSTTIGGLDMLVAQAELQFAWWTGETPSSGVFRDAAERALGLRPTDAAGEGAS